MSSLSQPSADGLKVAFRRSNGDGFVLDVSLEIAGDETVALLGPNGAGKSTLVEVIAGLQAVDAGAVVLNGTTLDDAINRIFVPADSRRIGVVFQDYLLFDHLSVHDNVAFSQQFGQKHSSDGPGVTTLMEQLDLTPLAERKPPSLSGGQRQRVALARALAMNPSALMLDEPMAALDINARSAVRCLLGQLLPTVVGPRLLITHDPVDAFLLADRICVLEGGRVTQVGTTEEIRRRPATEYIAAAMGTNLLHGHNTKGMINMAGSDLQLHTVYGGSDGPVVVTIAPNTVALHQRQPDGSPRNTWSTSVATVERRGDITRVVLAAPLPLEVDITVSAADALDVQPGSKVWAAVKATEIAVTEGRSMPHRET